MKPEKKYTPEPYVKVKHPEWSRNAVIYQINTRQFTEEGTFRAAESHLDRLKELGVDILWLMPVHEIGQKNRKGKLGSPYAVRDYYSVNRDLGTLEDLKHFTAEAHRRNMQVILDWVANHTAWDCSLTESHPEWYLKDWKGEFRPTPWWDWDDIIDLDYSNSALREYMTAAMKYWVREADIDGFRCDVAGFVPVDFWNNVRKELDLIKPVFMLAEWESRDLHAESFDMTYSWSWYDAVQGICSVKNSLEELFIYYSWNEKAFPEDSYRMTFLSNHDKNSWDGTQYEQFGPGTHAAIVLSVTGEGMPLIYNGQEAGNTKRLKFFDKDRIDWKDHPTGELYKKLIAFRKRTPALWNGVSGGTMIRVPNSEPGAIFSFVRMKDGSKVFTVINFSGKLYRVHFSEKLYTGAYTEILTGNAAELKKDFVLELEPWDFRIYASVIQETGGPSK